MAASRTALAELAANFGDTKAQGPRAYAEQFLIEHPDYGNDTAKADSIAAVQEFCEALASS